MSENQEKKEIENLNLENDDFDDKSIKEIKR